MATRRYFSSFVILLETPNLHLSTVWYIIRRRAYSLRLKFTAIRSPQYLERRALLLISRGFAGFISSLYLTFPLYRLKESNGPPS